MNIRRCLAWLLALLFCVSATAEQEALTVGTDIGGEEIADFRYTVDASTWPPFFLCFRLCMEDGTRVLYHETRMGEDWPLTEENTVLSGRTELSGEDWTAVVACLQGGTARPWEDEVLDGDEGPWMALSRTGNEGQRLAFSFASYGKRLDFEALCSALAQNHVLIRFRFTRGGSMMPQTREVILERGGYVIRENDGEPRPLDPALAEELLQIVEECRLESWNGFDGDDPDVLDGETFQLTMIYADGSMVTAYGSNEFPAGYGDAANRLHDFFMRERMARAAGTYRYEGEGFGGDFTITLCADGTYTFYEGPLSSYLGGGSWSEYDGEILMTEENGFDLTFRFGVEDVALVCLAGGSDPFPYVKTAEGERFVRQDTQKGEDDE